MSRLAILEFSKHNEVVWSYVKLILQEERSVDVYVNEFVYNQLYDFHDSRITWIIKHDMQSVEEFVNMHKAHLLIKERLIFTSVPPRDLKIFMNEKLASISSLLIHDVHYYFSDTTEEEEGKNVLKVIKGQLLQEKRFIESSFKI